MSNNLIKTNFLDPNQISGLTSAIGDLIIGSGSTGVSNLNVGTNGQVLIANSAQPLGIEWSSPSSLTLALGDLTNVTDSGTTGVVMTLEGSATTGNLFFGQSSGLSANNNVNSTSMGNFALEDLTTGTGNTSFGNQSNRHITSGDSNTSVGFNAGNLILTGSNNIAIGTTVLGNSGASSGTITGNNNIGIGRLSLRDITSGTNNIAIGESLLDDITTGADNISIGSNNCPGTTTQSQIITIGKDSVTGPAEGFDLISIGINNINRTSGNGVANDIVAIGKNILQTITNSSVRDFDNIVAIGTDVLQNADPFTTGNNSTRDVISIGNSSMKEANNGPIIGSIAIGVNALYNGCNNSIGIGRNAGSRIGSAPDGGNNNIAIGDGAIGSNLTSVHDLSSNNIAIGQNTLSNINGNMVRNIAIGENAIEGTGVALGDTPSDNIGIGENALRNIATNCASNIAIGQNAGISITGRDDNICIGRNADVDPSVNDGVAIGANAFCNNDFEIRLGENVTSSGNARLFFRTQLISQESWIGGGTTTASINNSGSFIRTPSDSRIKENILPIENSLDTIKSLNPVKFDYITDWKQSLGDCSIGFLAQDIQLVMPELVYNCGEKISEEESDELLGFDQTKLIPFLVGAIKTLSERVETLEAQLNP